MNTIENIQLLNRAKRSLLLFSGDVFMVGAVGDQPSMETVCEIIDEIILDMGGTPHTEPSSTRSNVFKLLTMILECVEKNEFTPEQRLEHVQRMVHAALNFIIEKPLS